MPLTPSLLAKLSTDHPAVQFHQAEEFRWSPEEHTVFYATNAKDADALLLHELAHGLLDHHTYNQDVALVTIEMQAWEKARELAITYGVTIDEEALQDHLDTYREWLHARSTCPECEAIGYEEKPRHYRCLACAHLWRVNDARLCALRRYSATQK